MMNIPFMRLDRQFSNIKQEVLDVVEKAFKHGKVLQGEEVEAIEKQLAELFQIPHAVAVGSGTDALIFSLKALGLKQGGRVAVTSLSFIASASAIVHAGGIPVFVDIDDTYLTDRQSLLSLISNKRVDGIIAVHLYGQMMDMEEIYAEVKKRGIFVIEDAAQCFGATRNGYMPGKYSDAVCLSFDPTKVIGAYGSGGAVLTKNEKIKNRIIHLRYHGHIGSRIYEELGYNSQLATIQAALILLKLRYLKQWQKRRIAIAAEYSRQLSNISNIKTPLILYGNGHIFHKYVVRVKGSRDKLTQYLLKKGISTAIHYSLPLHKQPCFKNFERLQSKLPVVEGVVKEILSLPIYPELKDSEINYICAQIKRFSQQGKFRD